MAGKLVPSLRPIGRRVPFWTPCSNKRFPTELIYYRYAATLLYKIGKPKEALAQLQKARKAGLKLDPPSRQLQKKIRAALA